MEIAFNTQYLRELCEIDSFVREELGSKIAKELQNRISDILSAESIYDLPYENPILITTSRYFLINLVDGLKIKCIANHVTNPIDENGNIDWKQVTRIKIIKIDKQ